MNTKEAIQANDIVYEYQYIYRNYIDCPLFETERFYKDDNEFLEREVNDKNFRTYQRLGFTKRERLANDN